MGATGWIGTYIVTGPFAYGHLVPGDRVPDVGSFDAREKRAVVRGDGKGRVRLTTEDE